MKTFKCWCAANIGFLGIILAIVIIGVICLFRMKEMAYVDYSPLYLCFVIIVFMIPSKSYLDIIPRIIALFGIISVLFLNTTVLSHTTKVALILVMVLMALVGLVLAAITTIYIWNNFSEVTSRRMLYRNSPVEMFDIRLNYCIHQFLETFTVMAALVLLIVVCVEIKPIVEAQKAGNDGYWALQVYNLFFDYN